MALKQDRFSLVPRTTQRPASHLYSKKKTATLTFIAQRRKSPIVCVDFSLGPAPSPAFAARTCKCGRQRSPNTLLQKRNCWSRMTESSQVVAAALHCHCSKFSPKARNACWHVTSSTVIAPTQVRNWVE